MIGPHYGEISSTEDITNCKTNIGQFFLRSVLKPKDKEAIRNSKKTMYIHTPFNANFANCKEPTLGIIQHHLNQIADLKAACVLHFGSNGTIENVANGINSLIIPDNTKYGIRYPLLIENSAGSGTQLGTSFEDFRKLREMSKNFGICLDTQHAFASGMCSFETSNDVVKWFDEADEVFPEGVTLIHLNDSLKKYNSKVDRHASFNTPTSQIWNIKKCESLKTLVTICKIRQIDMILETPFPEQDIIFISDILQQ